MRLMGLLDERLFPCDDWAYLFRHYAVDDLASSGMPADKQRAFFSPDTPCAEKYTLVAPFWERIKHTGYALAVRHTLRDLYGEEDLTPMSAARLEEKYRAR